MPVLSRTQQNDVYEEAVKLGLDPLDFDLKTEDHGYGGPVETFTHRPTKSRIVLSVPKADFYLQWWPAFAPGECIAAAYNWNTALVLVVKWLNVVKTNHDAPDLWAEARKARQLTDAAGQVTEANTPFSPAELELLKPKLDEVEAYIESRQPLDAEQKKIVRGRFQYLLGAAKRGLGRVDWLNIFVGQIFQMFADGVLNSSLYGEVMRHAVTALGSVIRLGSKLLGP
jgi:hypothetical protein